MSEVAKVAYLQEKIREAGNRETSGFHVFLGGIFVLFIVYLASVYFEITPNDVILLTIFGTLMLVGGIIQAGYYLYKKDRLMKELRQMAETT